MNFTDIQNAIYDALANAKIYIDAKDDSVKAYADTKIEALMNTSDLNAKLALLTEINTILDGDAATVGFQAWQAQVTKLTGIVADFEVFKALQTEASNVSIANVAALAETLNTVKTTLENSISAISSNSEANNVAIVTAFTSMQSRVATLFAV